MLTTGSKFDEEMDIYMVSKYFHWKYLLITKSKTVTLQWEHHLSQVTKGNGAHDRTNRNHKLPDKM